MHHDHIDELKGLKILNKDVIIQNLNSKKSNYKFEYFSI